MPKIRFTEEDLLERNQLSAGWRRLKVKSVTEGPGRKDPTSTVWECVFTVTEPGKDYGTPIHHWFSEKAMGRIVDFIRAFTGGKAEKDKDYDLDDTIGREVMGYCKYDVDQKWNTIEDFRPAGAAPPQKPPTPPTTAGAQA